ncbi:PAAR domain-containing protein [Spirosoma sp. SC4-14]|uniref:PAAR domain-containing protein n=1 Tax=Spirosoma sp. SC4-14 TaxID=3128900 RepID=UPI0030CC70C5
MGFPAARMNDPHLCPLSDGPKPHVGGTILPPGVPTVLIGNVGAATLSSPCLCASPAPNLIAKGSAGVFIGKKPAARQFDTTAHGGMITVGLPTVLIGDSSMGPTRAVTLLPNGDIMFGPNIIIKADPNNADFQMQALQALIRLNCTPTMQKAFSAIEGSGNSLTIVPYVPPAGWGPFNAYCQPGAATPGKTGTPSTVAWDPNVHSLGGPPNSVQPADAPGSDVILAHEMIHGTHNATGTNGNGPFVNNGPGTPQGSNVSEERGTVGLPTQTYNNPGNPSDPLNGSTLPATNTNPYTENGVRQDYANNGWPSAGTNQPPVQRPSYYPSGPGNSGTQPF